MSEPTLNMKQIVNFQLEPNNTCIADAEYISVPEEPYKGRVTQTRRTLATRLNTIPIRTYPTGGLQTAIAFMLMKTQLISIL